MSLWPSNSAQTISFGGYTKLAHKTQVTGFFSYGLWSNNEPLQPFTINSALPTIALPRANADAEAHVFSTNLNLTSHPTTDWRFGARFRNYTYSNHMPATSITQYVAYDSSVSTTPTGGPDLYAHDRTTFDADATWGKLKPLALTVGYTHNGNGYDARTFKSSGEDVFRVSADAVGTYWATFRVQYEVGSRTGSGLDEKQLTDIGEHPEMRYYDLANRTRNRFTGQVDIVPSDVWMFSVSGGLLHDDYGDTVFGLQKSNGDTFSLGRRLPPAERPGRGRHLQLRAVYRTAAVARGRFVSRAVQRSPAQLDVRLDRDGPLFFHLRDAAPHRPQHRGAVLVRFQPRGRQ